MTVAVMALRIWNPAGVYGYGFEEYIIQNL